jgi:diguanylate cyclase (GGDEF)-like protein
MQDSMQQLTDELFALRKAFEVVRQPAFVVDAINQCIVDVNPAGCEALGVARCELIGRSWNSAAGQLQQAALHVVDGNEHRFVAVAREQPSDRSETWRVQRDALTGLPNREELLARVSWDTNGESLGGLALLFIDLDDFKQVNDTWGHMVGDRVLQVVAERLSTSVRPNDLVVRYGGDEFVVAVEGARRRRDLERRARRITRAVQRPFLLEGREFVLSASIGIARRTSRMASVEALLAAADRAMYRAKSQSRTATTTT